MSIFQKLFTAIRGGAREVGEGLVDANAIRIFEQEIHDSEQALAAAKKGLTEVMAKEMQTNRTIKMLDEKIAEHEDYAAQALSKDQESLAMEIALKIADFENEKAQHVTSLSGFQSHITKLKQQIKAAEKTIKDNQRQLTMVKTTESVQQATMAVNDTLVTNQSSMASAKQSLERIKQRQADRQDQLDAAEMLAAETNGDELADKMHAAGIGKDAQQGSEILARIRAKSEQS